MPDANSSWTGKDEAFSRVGFDDDDPVDGSDDAYRQTKARRPALIGLAVALTLAIGTYLFVSQAAEQGIQRLVRIDAVRAHCTSLWQQARNNSDSSRVDATALADTIDPRSSAALKRCGDLRAVSTRQLPNARQLTGEPMPKGLR